MNRQVCGGIQEVLAACSFVSSLLAWPLVDKPWFAQAAESCRGESEALEGQAAQRSRRPFSATSFVLWLSSQLRLQIRALLNHSAF